MASFKPKNADVFQIGAMIVALTIMIAAGFLFLYFKSELDVRQTSAEIGILREMLSEHEVLSATTQRAPLPR